MCHPVPPPSISYRPFRKPDHSRIPDTNSAALRLCVDRGYNRGMSNPKKLSIFAFLILVLCSYPGSTQEYKPVIPKTWDEEALATLELPLPNTDASLKYISVDYYYKMPVLPVYKTYPVYRVDREPKGYMEWLAKQEP